MSAIISKIKPHLTGAAIGAVLMAVGGYLTGSVDIVSAAQTIISVFTN